LQELGSKEAELAKRFFLKARYWADPKAWTRKKLKKANIQLSQIESETERLLGLAPNP
jgi:hypothetical protein